LDPGVETAGGRGSYAARSAARDGHEHGRRAAPSRCSIEALVPRRGEIMNRLRIIALAGASLLLATTGCRSHHYGNPSAPLHAAVYADLEVDVEVGGETQGTAQETAFMFISMGNDTFMEGVEFSNGASSGSEMAKGFFSGEPFSKVKGAALYNALNGKDADFIVNPRYEVHVENYVFFKKVTCTVYGNLGKIVGNYRQIKRS
jgi:hypothetical protein